MCTEPFRRLRGFTLPELLLLIVVLAVGLGGILAVYLVTTRHSADPMVQKQAMAIAESMLEEVLAHPYQVIGTPPATKDQTTRAAFDDIRDYDGFHTDGVYRYEDATPIAGLEAYSVDVTVAPGMFTVPSLAVTVSVTGPQNVSYALTGYKFDY